MLSPRNNIPAKEFADKMVLVAKQMGKDKSAMPLSTISEYAKARYKNGYLDDECMDAIKKAFWDAKIFLDDDMFVSPIKLKKMRESIKQPLKKVMFEEVITTESCKCIWCHDVHPISEMKHETRINGKLCEGCVKKLTDAGQKLVFG